MFYYIKKIFKFIIGEIQTIIFWLVLSYPDSRLGKFIRKNVGKKGVFFTFFLNIAPNI